MELSRWWITLMIERPTHSMEKTKLQKLSPWNVTCEMTLHLVSTYLSEIIRKYNLIALICWLPWNWEIKDTLKVVFPLN